MVTCATLIEGFRANEYSAVVALISIIQFSLSYVRILTFTTSHVSVVVCTCKGEDQAALLLVPDYILQEINTNELDFLIEVS